MMMTNCAKMRSFNCFTFIIGTMPPGRRTNAWHPHQTERSFLRGARRGVNEAHGYQGRQGGMTPNRGRGGSWPRAGEPDEVLDGHAPPAAKERSEEHTSELQSQSNLVCRLLLEKKKKK